MTRLARAFGACVLLAALAASGGPAAAEPAPQATIVPVRLADGAWLDDVIPCADGGVWVKIAAGRSGRTRMDRVAADGSVTQLPELTKRPDIAPIVATACYQGNVWLRDPVRMGALVRVTPTGYARVRVGQSDGASIGAIHPLPDGGADVLTQTPGAHGEVRVVRLTPDGGATTLLRFSRRPAEELVAEWGFLDGADGRTWLPLVQPLPGEHGQWSSERRTRFVLVESDGRARELAARTRGIWDFAGPDATGRLWYTVAGGGERKFVGTVSPSGRISQRRARSVDPLWKVSQGIAARFAPFSGPLSAATPLESDTFLWQGTLVPRLGPAGRRWAAVTSPWTSGQLARAAAKLRSLPDTPTIDWDGHPWWVSDDVTVGRTGKLNWLGADGTSHRVRVPGGVSGKVTIDAAGNLWVHSGDLRNLVRVTVPGSG